MSMVLLAAAIWPFVLLALGLLLGRVLRHGDRVAEHQPAATAGSPGTPRPRGVRGQRVLPAALRGGGHALTGP